jgi:PAS domain S-box-containing protein
MYSASQSTLRGTAANDDFFARSPDLLCVIDSDGCFERLNPAFERLLGVRCDELIGTRLDELVHREDRSMLGDFGISREATPPGVTADTRFRRRDESHCMLAWTFSAPDERGATYASARDVTGLKAAEERGGFHTALLCAIGMAVIATDVDGAITFWNQGAESTCGWRAEEVIGRNIVDVTPAEMSRAQAEEIGASLGDGKPWAGEFPVQRRSGERFPALVTDVPVRDASGTLVAIVGVSADLTEQRAVEDALRASEARYRTLCEAAPVGVFQTDGTGAVTYTNRRMLALWGAVEEHELLGHQWLGRVCREERDRMGAAWTAAIDASQGFEHEYRLALPDGEVRCVRGQATALHDDSGRLIGTVGTVEDITERRRTEEILRGQATTFALLNDGVILADVDGNVVDWNPAAARIFGYARGEMLGRSAQLLYANDTAAEQHATIAASMKSSGQWEGEVRIKRPDGTDGICETRVVLLRNAEGEPIGGIGVNRDVTERKRAERALHESQERYRLVVETAHEGICTVDASGTLTYANARLAEMMGCEESELVGSSLFDHMDVDAAVAARDSFARRLRGRSETSAVLLRRTDGSSIWVRSSASPMLADGMFAGAVYMLNDITEQHDAQRQLVESERHFRALTEQSSELVGVLDARGRIRYANAAFSRTLGYLPEEALGFAVLDLTHPDDLPRLSKIFEELLDAPGSIVSVEYRARHQGGEWRTLRTVVQNLLADPAIGGIVVNAHDITASREAEEIGRQQRELLATVFDHIPAMVTVTDANGRPAFANREWARISGWPVDQLNGADLFKELYPDPELRARMEEFVRAAQGQPCAFRMRVRDGRMLETVWTTVALSDGSVIGMGQDVTERCHLEEQLRQSQKMEAVGSLAGGVAHDFNNLLTVIMSYAMVLLAELPAEDPMCADLQEIQAAAERAASLTRQLLAFSRQQVLDPRVIDLRGVVTGVERMLRRLIGEDIQLAIPGGDPAHVLADSGQIEQVVMNLVVNARDAMPAGGDLAIEIEPVDISAPGIETKGTASHHGIAPGRYVCLRVRDTGHGMSASTRSRIFDPFFTTKDAGKGTGLGLATVYGIVKQSGGYIHVESVPDEGTTFAIHLPCVEPAEEEAGSESATTALPERRGATVLLVEDKGSLLAIVQRILEQRGYQVLTASDGVEALAVAERHGSPVQLLLTDVVMPRGSGQELAQRLAARWGEIPVLFMTGHSMDAVTKHGVLRPGSQLLKKPFTPQDLALAVSELLHAHP